MARAITIRDRMKEIDERCLRDSIIDIEESVEANHIVSHLYAARVINLDDKTEITSKRTRKQRIQLLIDKLILHGGSTGFMKFIEALEKSHYVPIAKKLMDCAYSGVDGVDRDTLRDDIKNRKRGSNIERRVELVRDWLFQVENKVTQIYNMKDDITAITNVLNEVKELSRMGLETKVTIETLSQQLQEKTKKLEEAEKLISLLENKVQDLQEERKKDKMEINSLKDSVVEQELKIIDLNKQVNSQSEQIKDKGMAIEELKIKDADKEARLEKLERVLVKNQQQTTYVSRYKQKTLPKIKPRNRFQ